MSSGRYSDDMASPYSLGSFLSFINNNFVVLAVAAVVLFAGFYLGAMWKENAMLKGGGIAAQPTNVVADNGAAAPTQPTTDFTKFPKVTDDDHIRGNKNAKVLLVEYSDFECPYCGKFHPTITAVNDEYGDDVAVVYRHFPLSFHPNAEKAAEGSECVTKQKGNDGFWAYADYLFEQNLANGKLSPDDIQQAAQTAGVNMDSFNTCLDSGEMADKVAKEQTAGGQVGVTGTPGTLVVTKDGAQEIIPGALPEAQIKTIVDKYL